MRPWKMLKTHHEVYSLVFLFFFKQRSTILYIQKPCEGCFTSVHFITRNKKQSVTSSKLFTHYLIMLQHGLQNSIHCQTYLCESFLTQLCAYVRTIMSTRYYQHKFLFFRTSSPAFDCHAFPGFKKNAPFSF